MIAICAGNVFWLTKTEKRPAGLDQMLSGLLQEPTTDSAVQNRPAYGDLKQRLICLQTDGK
jgi:hypothetical protein